MNYKDAIAKEKALYFSSYKNYLKEKLFQSDTYYIWKFLYYLGMEEMYYASKGSAISQILLLIYRRKKNRLGRKLGFDIPVNVLGWNVRIYHKSPVIINPHAKIGEDAIIVGNLCIGNVDGLKIAPQIGGGTMFGWGCSVIGNVHIADGCKIGAKALVINDVDQKNAVMVGVPARNVAKE